MSGSSRRRRTTATGTVTLLAAIALLASGCVGIPDEGPVVEAESDVRPGEQLGYFNDPPGPAPNESATDIVRHFLDAQAAFPLQTNTAKEFLTSEEATTWRPERRIITYDAASFPQGSNQVTVELDGANQLDSRGSWRGPLPADQTELSFSMTRVDGQWRISDAPDALIVPSTWFDRAFRRVSLYFTDPTASILVPEPVYVPRGDSLASVLVDGLLAGPVVGAPGVERSFLPPGLEVDLSVTVSERGIAEVPLIGGAAAMPTDEDANLMVAQLARTLAQDSTLTGFRVTIDSEPVTLSDGDTEFEMDEGESLDPAGSRATSLLFGLRDGRLVSGTADAFEPVSGPMGQSEVGVRSVGVSLDGTRVAGVLTSGDAVQVTDVRTDDAEVVQVASGATDLAPPVWDAADRLWLLDRARGVAQISAVVGENARTIEVPGISGERVAHLLVSRDGSRMVAVVRGGLRGRDRVVVSRLQYDPSGRPLGGTSAREIAWEDQGRLSVVDVGWSSPTSVVVAHRLGGNLFQVRTLAVDGAPVGLAGVAVTLSQRPRMLVTSPRATDPLYVLTSSGLSEVVGGLRSGEIDERTTFLTYAGG
ncbi:LpqB family beta-propeller domain-containing protein [Nocardioides sp.]|uniref:LpqB family beta-propeller domain-containing protein n=1 Tax=Nocardioides sp. TaxID=35761 RepID=UPI002ED68AEC